MKNQPFKQKTIRAWAIITKWGSLELYDHRLPICWLRKIAIQEAKKWGGEVVPVLITFPTKNEKDKR